MEELNEKEKNKVIGFSLHVTAKVGKIVTSVKARNEYSPVTLGEAVSIAEEIKSVLYGIKFNGTVEGLPSGLAEEVVSGIIYNRLISNFKYAAIQETTKAPAALQVDSEHWVLVTDRGIYASDEKGGVKRISVKELEDKLIRHDESVDMVLEKYYEYLDEKLGEMIKDVEVEDYTTLKAQKREKQAVWA